ncbi:substrate-binding periplasmic protein [Rhodoferax bucti]|uniref:substrate-binding periplasmic protein n=1 Tax=Rhodoferax bucti TaxID=2576305 RepID=UPI001476EF60|nr:transporter substrate-binding domain-containing protein [Rhodoferax bucti]
MQVQVIHPAIRSAVVTVSLMVWAGASAAHCSRAVQVPVSATGYSVVIEGQSVRGIYPEMLKSISDKENCRFAMTPVPRARLEKLFETGKADMIVAAQRSTHRDEFGVFVPMVRSRATLISLDDAQRAPFKNFQELVDHKEARLVVVRGYDYGSGYQDLIDTLSHDNRVVFEVDPQAVGRLLKSNPGDVTIMVPTILYGAMQEDPRLRDQLDKLRIEPLDNLVWGESGVYLAKAMEPGLFKYLLAAMQRAAQSGTVHKGFASYYPVQVLKDSIKPLDRPQP